MLLFYLIKLSCTLENWFSNVLQSLELDSNVLAFQLLITKCFRSRCVCSRAAEDSKWILHQSRQSVLRQLSADQKTLLSPGRVQCLSRPVQWRGLCHGGRQPGDQARRGQSRGARLADREPRGVQTVCVNAALARCARLAEINL